MASYIVTAPLVIVKQPPEGTDAYLYAGSVLPDYVSDDDAKRLEGDGLVEKVSASQAKNAPAPGA